MNSEVNGNRDYFELLTTVHSESGILHNLRTETTVEQVRDFHKKFYRTDNLTLIISGKVPPRRVFDALHPVIDKINKNPYEEEFVRPWQTPIEKLVEPQDLKVGEYYFLLMKFFSIKIYRYITQQMTKILVDVWLDLWDQIV